MAVERVFTVKVSAIAHAEVSLPNPLVLLAVVKDALDKAYPHVSLRSEIQAKDNELGEAEG